MTAFWAQTVPTWLSAVGTVGAAGTAAWGLWRAEQATKLARAETRLARVRAAEAEADSHAHQMMEAERAQAVKVAVWESRSLYSDVDEPEPGPASHASITGGPSTWDPAEHGLDANGMVYAASVQNNSDSPISDVVIYWMNPNGSAEVASRHLDTTVVEPWQRIRKQRPLGLLNTVRFVPVELQFTDHNGRTWRLNRAGKLRKLDDAAPIS